MLKCPNNIDHIDSTFATLFYNVSSSFFLLLIFFHFTSILLAKLFVFFGGNPFYQRNEDGYEFNALSDEEMEDEEEENVYYGPMEKNHFVGNIIDISDSYEAVNEEDQYSEEQEEDDESLGTNSDGTWYSTPATQSSYEEEEDEEEEEVVVEEILSTTDIDSEEPHDRNGPTNPIDIYQHSFRANNNATHQVLQDKHDHEDRNEQKMEMNFRQKEDNFMVFQPSVYREGRKLVQEKDKSTEIYEDTFTIGSTSKDSSEWRSSINCNTEDPFSSSSRRSCPKWESYTVFQKYDEEMLFLDRISAQKLHETESLRSIQACPRSISERIVLKLGAKKNKLSEFGHSNPYHELESAYVAQICLTWEALNWNYKFFQRLRASRKEFDPGCPAYVAQQFQQFQVLLQRYVENEPYEHGRRPEIYARMRSMAPKLLQVPEYKDSEEREEGAGSRIPSTSFILILEEAIRTYMNFMKQDKKSHCQILADMFKRSRKGSADATLLLLLKKVNQKKKAKLNELRRSGKCLRRKKLKIEEEIEIMMAQIDLKVVSRVLRMGDINGEQLHWCENKMSKVRVSDGKLHRDSTPLFFPAH